MMDNERSVPGCLFALAMIVLAAFATLALGCGSTPEQTARHTVDGIGMAVDVTDQAFAIVYTVRAREALDAASSLEQYRASMHDLDAVVAGLRTAHAALDLGDAAVRIWEQGGVNSWPQAFGCIVGSLVGVRNLLAAAGVAVPAELLAVLDMVHGAVDTDGCFVAADAGTGS